MAYNVRRCKFLKNGDVNFPGLSMIVSENIYRNYQSLLNELSSKLVLPTGPVNYLFDYETGKIAFSLDEILCGKNFIASTSSYLKENQYYDDSIYNWKGSASSGISVFSSASNNNIKQNSNSLASPISTSSLNNNNNNYCHSSNNNSECQTNGDSYVKPRIINVIRFNDRTKHANFLLNHRSATSLDYVLNELSLFPQLGKVDKLFTKDGKKVSSLKDLFGSSMTFYAANYYEKFNKETAKPIKSNSTNHSPFTSPKITIKGGSSNTTPILIEKRKSVDKNFPNNQYQIDCATPYKTPQTSEKKLLSQSFTKKQSKNYLSFSLPELANIPDKNCINKELSTRFASLQLKVENNRMVETIAQLRSALEVLEFKYCQEMHKNIKSTSIINYSNNPTPKKSESIEKTDYEEDSYTDGSYYEEENTDVCTENEITDTNQCNLKNNNNKKQCCHLM